MPRIAIPADVYQRAVEFSDKGEGQGKRQMKVLREYLSGRIAQGEELDGYERDKFGNLFAVTRPVVADTVDVGPEFKRKPKR